MQTVKCVFSIAFQNFRKWRTDSRIWLIAAVQLTMVLHALDKNIRVYVDLDTTPMTAWAFVALRSYNFQKMLLNTPLILLFCNAPFTDRNQTFVYLRSGRLKWLCGQILYIIMASGIFFLTMFLESVLFAGHGAKFTLDWDEAALAVPAIKMLSIYFTPLSAVGFTLLFSWLSGIFIGLLMFFCNYMTGSKPFGAFVSSFFVMFGIIASYSEDHNVVMNSLVRFSPLSWMQLNSIAIGKERFRPSFAYVMCVYSGLIVLLTAAILIFGRRKSLDIRED